MVSDSPLCSLRAPPRWPQVLCWARSWPAQPRRPQLPRTWVSSFSWCELHDVHSMGLKPLIIKPKITTKMLHAHTPPTHAGGRRHGRKGCILDQFYPVNSVHKIVYICICNYRLLLIWTLSQNLYNWWLCQHFYKDPSLHQITHWFFVYLDFKVFSCLAIFLNQQS